MLCTHCGQDNPLGSPKCFNCQTSLIGEPKPIDGNIGERAKKKASRDSSYGLIGLAVSIVGFQLIAPSLFSPTPGINLLQVGAAGLAGGLGMVLGRAIGKRSQSGAEE